MNERPDNAGSPALWYGLTALGGALAGFALTRVVMDDRLADPLTIAMLLGGIALALFAGRRANAAARTRR